MKLFQNRTKRTIKEFRSELARAHMLIALMSLSVIVLLSSIGSASVTFDVRVTSICIALLSVVTLISLGMSVTLFRKKS